MRTLKDIAEVLERERRRQNVSYEALAEAAGLTPLSTRRALQAKVAPRATTLMALAERLGLELVLVPREVAQGLAASAPAEVPVLTSVQKLASSGSGENS